VRRRYLAQFYPPHEFDRTEVQLRAGEGDRLCATGKRIVVPGWRELFGTDDDDAEVQALPPLAEGDRCQVSGVEVEAKKTTPPAHYTEGTLIAAMKNVSRLVEDPRLRSDSRRPPESGPRRRAPGSSRRCCSAGSSAGGRKHLVATDTGCALVDALPAPVTDPGTTALWEQALEEIAEGRRDPAEFLKQQADWVRRTGGPGAGRRRPGPAPCQHAGAPVPGLWQAAEAAQGA
jgi:DNA topoisomerase III